MRDLAKVPSSVRDIRIATGNLAVNRIGNRYEKAEMTDEKLVLQDNAFLGNGRIKTVARVNKIFELGIDRDLETLGIEIDRVLSTLRSPNIGNADSLLHLALLVQGHSTSQRAPLSLNEVEAWHRLGYPDIAAIFEEYYALANEVKINIKFQGTQDEHPVVANAAAINAKCRKLDRKLAPLVAGLEFTPDDITEIVCDVFNLDLRPDHKFRDYWIDRILTSSKFAEYAPSLNQDGLPHFEPFGWVTKRHVSVLKAHGYSYRFAFWEEPVGETRGHLWIQTDKGPLVLSDKTDSVSLRTNFPVQVSNLKRRKLFKLRKQDLDGKPAGGNVLRRWLGLG